MKLDVEPSAVLPSQRYLKPPLIICALLVTTVE